MSERSIETPLAEDRGLPCALGLYAGAIAAAKRKPVLGAALMRVTLTLRDAEGVLMIKRTIPVRNLQFMAGDVGQAAHQLYGEAKARGTLPIGTTLAVTEAEETDLAREAAEIVKTGRRQQ